MSTHALVAAISIVVGISLAAYVLFGGADFGGGVWDLLARGPRADAQRRLVAEAIGPIWEANHVWLILIVVILFTAFPAAFARFSIDLHLPLTAALIGIVLRGSAFTFRAYDSGRDDVQRRWSRIFAISSLLTPLCLGTAAGAVAAGRILPTPEGFTASFVSPWLAPLPLAIGIMAVLLFAYLAAIYLALAASDPALVEDFRRRAQVTGLVLFVVAVAVAVWGVARVPIVRGALERPLAIGVGVVGTVAAGVALWALRTRRLEVARLAAGTQATAFIAGWGAAQWPWIIPPTLTVEAAAAPRPTLVLLLLALGAGAAILLPSLAYLFRVFGREARSEKREA
ncbi:MAG: cytochrome d ubiquinol oxidase subunit II [Gemmatimonadetes bacterium]|nr:cytochrome d ubiquinol oxidase subunit II [Gemmatimonadota bacterium]MCB9504994.1 cytochrome d ubiquinol oxidase subunit II [Gemmatimonadales bacterium]HPF62303.1 cytochrome d ubiquinol oxidase subunit II [Gemmatimonadales bacterium]HRX17571.1 cytochrome d ubiquinol oxidase subunit II [Gemmatimonadales bacterium]